MALASITASGSGGSKKKTPATINANSGVFGGALHLTNTNKGVGGKKPANNTNPPNNTDPPATKPANTGGGSRVTGSSGGSSVATPNYADQLIAYAKEQNEKSQKQALDALENALNAKLGIYDEQLANLGDQYAGVRDSALASLEQNFTTQNQAYDQQIGDLGDQYQQLRNQSEVEKYKAKSAMREALANRGQLDSGFGRQETLNLNTKFGNAINNINLQEQDALDEIERLRQALIADRDAQKLSINNQYQTSLNEATANLNTLKAQARSDYESQRLSYLQQAQNQLQQIINEIKGAYA